MSHIAVNPAVTGLVFADVEHDVRIVYRMSEAQEGYFNYMVGRRTDSPPIGPDEQREIIQVFSDAAYGYPIVDTFDSGCFPGIQMARRLRRGLSPLPEGQYDRQPRPKDVSRSGEARYRRRKPS